MGWAGVGVDVVGAQYLLARHFIIIKRQQQWRLQLRPGKAVSVYPT